ncbi:unnamed protein product [Penicillium olsonii]|nr:unnamed protein product [Penicillium olsonii]
MAAKEMPRTLVIDRADAETWNRDLMEAFRQALEKDPTADLLSVVDTRYTSAHRSGQYAGLSEAARLNRKTVDQIGVLLHYQPEANLREMIPTSYDRLYRWANPKEELKAPSQPAREALDWLRQIIDPITTATIVYPLSTRASELLNQPLTADGMSGTSTLASTLKDLCLKSDIIFELSIRKGAVLKCSEDLIIKTFPSSRGFTEYHNLQYLAEKTPDLPIPKPHGLIMLDSIGIMLMSYVPGTTLQKVWPSLSPDGKLSIQKQLEEIFSRIREIRQDDGIELGDAQGEGVKDDRIMDMFSRKGITMARDFDKLQFSAKHRASPFYVKLLRSFLEEDCKTLQGSVFTHGDLKKSNIMAQEDPENAGHFVITGIIDWEDSGFYPEYYEATRLSSGQSIDHDDDWYLYSPHCISPLRFPVRWLVDRLWGNLLWNWMTDVGEPLIPPDFTPMTPVSRQPPSCS